MKTVEEMIAKKMRIININMIQIIQSPLTGHQLQQEPTQENHHQTINTIVPSPITHPSTPNNQTNTRPSSNEYQPSQDSHQQKTTLNSKRNQDEQLCPDYTQEIIKEDDQNDTIMEDQEKSNQTNQRTPARLSTPNQRETRKQSPLVHKKTLSRLGKIRK